MKEDVLDAFYGAIVNGLAPKAEAEAEFIAKREVEIAAADKPRNFTQAGDVAEIRVEGTLTTRPSLYAMLFGGGNTTYSEIISSIALAENEPTVKRVVFDVRSPGGMVDGLFEALAAIQSLTKPRAVRGTQACSAAYAIAAVAGRIQAKNAAAEFGSIGVAATLFHVPEIIDITSTNAPKKRPNPSTEEGKAVIREYLDQIHDLFVDAIAMGRGTKPATINTEYGQGATLLAAEAKRRKMVDSIMTQAPRLVGAKAEETAADYDALFAEPTATIVALKPPSEAKPTAAGAANGAKKTMTKEELKTAHPDTYAAIFGAGKDEGVKLERDRCGAHLTLGLQAEGVTPEGALKTAVEAVKSGAEMTMTLSSEYLAAGMNRRDRQSAQADSDATGKVLAGTKGDGGATGTPVADLGDVVADAMEKAKGTGKSAA
jgi:ClpP class serine protease